MAKDDEASANELFNITKTEQDGSCAAGPAMANSPSTLTAARKFRIQTDWSDTGPNSVSMTEMESGDPRTYLARRLNDWFNNLTQARANSRASQVRQHQ